MPQPNILLVMSDEHSAAATGWSGHPHIRTPNLDNLFVEGASFDNAYCNAPMCVPSRMSFLTGRYGFDIDVWDNGSPLRAEIPTFATYLQAAGYDTTLCGRMHMIGPDRHHGFGSRLFDDMTGWQSHKQKPNRKPDWRRGNLNSHVSECGPGKGSWLEYDSTVAELALTFLRARERERREGTSSRPWLLVAGFMFPHFPLICPPSHFDPYYPNGTVLPGTVNQPLKSQHPVIQHLRWSFHNNRPLSEDLQRRALASYSGLVTLVDEFVGQMMEVIDRSELRNNTVVVYTSDHGEMGGQHGIWQKQCFYEAAVRVPLILRRPVVPARHPGADTDDVRCRENSVRIASGVSLIDIAPTLLDFAGVKQPRAMTGTSLCNFIAEDSGYERSLFSEYHAQGMLSAGFMLKKGDYKYNYYVGHPPELFNTTEDPDELVDLIENPLLAGKIQELDAELHTVVDPEQIDKLAKENQKLDGMKRASKMRSA